MKKLFMKNSMGNIETDGRRPVAGGSHSMGDAATLRAESQRKRYRTAESRLNRSGGNLHD